MLHIRERLASPASATVELSLPYELRVKHRLLTRLPSGVEVGLSLERGTSLRDGDCLRADDGTIVRVVAADEDLLEVRSAEPQMLARIAYHLGNRHSRVQVGPGWLRFAFDSVGQAMVEGLGATAVRLRAPFEPEPGAYAGTHTHSPGEGVAPRGVIHDMMERTRK
ncbi:MAG TPA: urease accessory protein UreE [Casimicrobiaceae bacterium]|nr:urease accessory protein UreE [Casimicrobiaceae bacterium]